MKLDATDVRYLTAEEFRVLTAVEMGSKNHEVVPTSLIAQISALRHAGISKLLGSLAKRKLVARVQNTMYDGFRLTYGGYDYLAVRALSKRKSVYAVGQQIGIGKESDIYIVSTEDGERRVLKIHRLGRISFRKIKEKRDYMGKRKSASWMYMSRLAAEKEYAFMKILHEHGFPVPRPLDQTRHTLLMSFEEAYPLRQIAALPLDQIRKLYAALMALIVRLAQAGLIHGDFNEFNLLIREIYADSDAASESSATSSEPSAAPRTAPALAADNVERGRGFERILSGAPPQQPKESDADDSDLDDDAIEIEEGVQVEPILIDFPQMVSIDHPNADYYFARDVECVRRFFRKRFRFESSDFPEFHKVKVSVSASDAARLDNATRASGSQKMSKDERLLETHFQDMQLDPTRHLNALDSDSIGDEEDDTASSGMLPSGGEVESEEDDGVVSDDDGGGDDEEAEVDDENDEMASSRHRRRPTPQAAPLDPAHVASRVATARAHEQRRGQKHHGRKSQATKAGRRHGGGKIKYSKAKAVSDSMQF